MEDIRQNRIVQLQRFAEENPQDPFPKYALALEYLHTDLAKCEALFELLLADFPDYLPTYYHAAAFFDDQNEPEKARKTYIKGIALAEKNKSIMALRELNNAYNNFLSLND